MVYKDAWDTTVKPCSRKRSCTRSRRVHFQGSPQGLANLYLESQPHLQLPEEHDHQRARGQHERPPSQAQQLLHQGLQAEQGDHQVVVWSSYPENLQAAGPVGDHPPGHLQDPPATTWIDFTKILCRRTFKNATVWDSDTIGTSVALIT